MIPDEAVLRSIGFSDLENTNAPIRLRFNFTAYAVGADGKTKISPDVNFFVRLSCQNNSSGIAQLVSTIDVQDDNQIGLGTTKTTPNLQ